MNYINTVTGEYPVAEGRIRPSGIANFVPPEGYAAVEQTAPPSWKLEVMIQELQPVWHNGTWSQAWAERPATEEEMVPRLALLNRGMA